MVNSSFLFPTFSAQSFHIFFPSCLLVFTTLPCTLSNLYTVLCTLETTATTSTSAGGTSWIGNRKGMVRALSLSLSHIRRHLQRFPKDRELQASVWTKSESPARSCSSELNGATHDKRNKQNLKILRLKSYRIQGSTLNLQTSSNILVSCSC